MIIDTSAWIDYSRHAAGPTGDAVSRAVLAQTAMTTDVIRLEFMVGTSAESQRITRRVLAGCTFVPQEPYFDVDDAVELFRRCQRAGETIRSPNDCLIAAMAIRIGVLVLHRDRDFDAIARNSTLRATRE